MVADSDIAALELVRMSGMCWPVELTFEESKDELGNAMPMLILMVERALRRVRYYQRRNHVAYLPHHKRKLAQLAAFDSAL